jgi:N-acetylneuraminic acid mutarotase
MAVRMCAAQAPTRRGLASAFAVALLAGGCGGTSARAPSVHAAHKTARAARHPRLQRSRPTSLHLTYHPRFRLPAPLRDPAAVGLGNGRFVLIGGLDGADVSTAEVTVADAHGVLRQGTLPLAQHDAQGALLDGLVYVFGGGAASELDHIVSFDPAHGSVSAAGSLPRAQSDVAVTASDGTAYIVGGYDGTAWLTTILAWRPGRPAKVVGRLPVGLRYAAASSVDGQIIIAGGSTPAGASNAVLRFDPLTGRVSRIGRLPAPTTHAAAATLGGFVYVVGGRGDDVSSQRPGVLSIDPRTGRVRSAGRLPMALSDAAVIPIGQGLLVAGGLSPSGTQTAVGELSPAS